MTVSHLMIIYLYAAAPPHSDLQTHMRSISKVFHVCSANNQFRKLSVFIIRAAEIND